MGDKMIENYGIANFSIDDFTHRKDLELEEYKVFDLNNDCFIFNKLYDLAERKEKGAIEVQVHKNIILSECITTFNKYQKWLNSADCKNELINKFCEFVNSYSPKKTTVEEIIRNKWYEELEINGAIITIPIKYEKMIFCIICVDNWHILYIEVEENRIISINDEYVDPENGLGYNGIWAKSKMGIE